jgi:ribosomal-protein-alanine N-acetyltransferase
VDTYYACIHSDADVMRFLPGGVPRPKAATPKSLQYFINHWEQHGFGLWAVEDKADGAFVGQAGLNVMQQTTDVEVVYALGKPYWGKGIATEAAHAALHYGFNGAGLDIIYAVAFPENAASQRVMVKLGMEYEGITSRYYNTEMACYSRQRANWLA